ncbi:hypothetical protein PLACP1_31900 [Planifilum fimeticola]
MGFTFILLSALKIEDEAHPHTICYNNSKQTDFRFGGEQYGKMQYCHLLHSGSEPKEEGISFQMGILRQTESKAQRNPLSNL